ncbi:MAG: CRISPR-associated protein Cas5 [Candidatus Thermoplasmatota archaeon]|nr:CRISPR-associated protein Cas5 [Candidatus Thermoplasmatota archaeon]
MTYLIFELSGDMAMWRNPFESMGSYSCLGPSPANLAGLLGAAMGMASPRSQGAATDWKALKQLDKNGLPWPVSPELLKWEEDNDYQVACRWQGGFPRRIPWNVNGCKEIGKGENLRLQQQVIDRPLYQVVVRLEASAAAATAGALQRPAFPLYLGASFCPAVVKQIRISDELPSGGNWAQFKKTAWGEVTPLSRHVINANETCERIHSDGYWLYPTPDFPGEIQTDPLIKGYCRLEKKDE